MISLRVGTAFKPNDGSIPQSGLRDVEPLLDFFAHHWLDIALAVVFAIVADLIRIGSLIRAGVRHVKNRLAEQSLARLRKRIDELEKYRATLSLYLNAERALYLHALGMILAVLVSMCFAGIVLVLERFGLFPNAEIFAAGMLGIAIVFGV